MKTALLTFCALVAATFCHAQNELNVTFSEEKDTLTKQHFVDRYEHVFMTKVPSRNMFKLNVSSSELTGKGLYAGYEFKILPALSLEAGVFAQTSRYNGILWHQIRDFEINNVSVWTRARARYYFNMNRRIKAGLSANNFSGAYVAVNYDQSLRLSGDYSWNNKNMARFGVLFGYQGRLFNHGHFDFNIGLFNKEEAYRGYSQFIEDPFDSRNFLISTQTNIGIALGDWKKKTKAPLCDVLACDEQLRGHLKVQLPDISIGLEKQIANLGFAYERKLGRSPFSAQAGLRAGIKNDGFFDFTSASSYLSIAVRAYLLQNLYLRKGIGGGSLSGPYLALEGGWGFHHSRLSTGNYPTEPRQTVRNSYHMRTTSLALGYQQRMFGKFYIDGDINYGSFNVMDNHTRYDYRRIRPYDFRSNLTIGFTF